MIVTHSTACLNTLPDNINPFSGFDSNVARRTMTIDNHLIHLLARDWLFTDHSSVASFHCWSAPAVLPSYISSTTQSAMASSSWISTKRRPGTENRDLRGRVRTCGALCRTRCGLTVSGRSRTRVTTNWCCTRRSTMTDRLSAWRRGYVSSVWPIWPTGLTTATSGIADATPRTYRRL